MSVIVVFGRCRRDEPIEVWSERFTKQNVKPRIINVFLDLL